MKLSIYQLLIKTLPAWCLLVCLQADAATKLAFERNNAIWVANLDGSDSKKLTVGSDPTISADGTKVAFTINDHNRHIATIAVNTGEITDLTNVASDNSYNPIWSPDDKTLLFNTFVNNEWHLAFINADNTNYRVIANTKGFHAPTWAADGKSFFAQNLTSIVQFHINGNQLKKWDITTHIPKGSMNSSSHMNIAPNGTTLIVEVDMDEVHHHKKWDSAPPALWLFDINKDKATRLTKTGMLAWSPYWINAEEFAFVSQGENDKQSSIYRGSVKEKPYVQIIKNARFPSVSH